MVEQHALCRDHSFELACMAVENNFIALGSRDYIVLLDARIKRSYVEIQLLANDYSIRSLQFKNRILSCGSGNGWLSFFDLRANDYIDIQRVEGSGIKVDKKIEVGDGWLETEGFYRSLLYLKLFNLNLK